MRLLMDAGTRIITRTTLRRNQMKVRCLIKYPVLWGSIKNSFLCNLTTLINLSFYIFHELSILKLPSFSSFSSSFLMFPQCMHICACPELESFFCLINLSRLYFSKKSLFKPIYLSSSQLLIPRESAIANALNLASLLLLIFQLSQPYIVTGHKRVIFLLQTRCYGISQCCLNMLYLASLDWTSLPHHSIPGDPILNVS